METRSAKSVPTAPLLEPPECDRRSPVRSGTHRAEPRRSPSDCDFCNPQSHPLDLGYDEVEASHVSRTDAANVIATRAMHPLSNTTEIERRYASADLKAWKPSSERSTTLVLSSSFTQLLQEPAGQCDQAIYQIQRIGGTPSIAHRRQRRHRVIRSSAGARVQHPIPLGGTQHTWHATWLAETVPPSLSRAQRKLR